MAFAAWHTRADVTACTTMNGCSSRIRCRSDQDCDRDMNDAKRRCPSERWAPTVCNAGGPNFCFEDSPDIFLMEATSRITYYPCPMSRLDGCCASGATCGLPMRLPSRLDDCSTMAAASAFSYHTSHASPSSSCDHGYDACYFRSLPRTQPAWTAREIADCFRLWAEQLRLSSETCVGLAVHLWEMVEERAFSQGSHSVTHVLATCLWLAVKLFEPRSRQPTAKQMSRVTGAPAQALSSVENAVMSWVDWAPLRGFSY